jgi:hypothetical protein
MRSDIVKSNADIVVLETLHHYAAATSLLLEDGLIDKLIFTEFDNGHPIIKKELDEFSKKDVIYFGGGYNKHCLTHSIIDIEDKISKNKIWGIKDLIINSPQEHYKTLKTSKIEGIDNLRIISIEDAIKQICNYSPHEKNN